MNLIDAMKSVSSTPILVGLLLGSNVFISKDWVTVLAISAIDLCVFVVVFLFLALIKCAHARLSEIVATWE